MHALGGGAAFSSAMIWFSSARMLSRCCSRRTRSFMPRRVRRSAASPRIASSTLRRSLRRGSITGSLPGGVKSVTNRRLNTSRGENSGGFVLSGPLCER
jgi:hypothetical protein